MPGCLWMAPKRCGAALPWRFFRFARRAGSDDCDPLNVDGLSDQLVLLNDPRRTAGQHENLCGSTVVFIVLTDWASRRRTADQGGETAHAVSKSAVLMVTVGTSRMLAGDLPSGKNLQRAVSRSLLIFIREVASFISLAPPRPDDSRG
jgi:hypothetical protein